MDRVMIPTWQSRLADLWWLWVAPLGMVGVIVLLVLLRAGIVRF